MATALLTPSKIRVFLGTLQVVVILPLLILALGLLAGVVPSLFQYESFVVQSGSMGPTLNVGDLAVAAPVRPGDLTVGTIIVYRTAENPGIVVTHRLKAVEVNPDGSLSFHTQGDANDIQDRVLVSEAALIGRVVYSLPKLGYLADFAKRGEGKLLLILLPALLLVLDYRASARRSTSGNVVSESGIAMPLLAQGKRDAAGGAFDKALERCNEAIAANPRLEEAWLFKAELIPDRAERKACLQVGLTINPGSDRLKAALALIAVPPTAATA
jgi:signal peptidase